MKVSVPSRKISVLIGSACLLFGSGVVNATVIDWTDWTSGGANPTGLGYVAQGTITTSTTTVGVTYTNPIGIGFLQTGSGGGTDYWTSGGVRNNAASPYTSAQVDNIPTGTGIVALQFAGSQTLQFSQTIANPVFSYVSLNGNGYAFNQDFNILSYGDGSSSHPYCGYWGCGNSYKQVVNLGGGNYLYELLSTGGEPHGTIQFTGAFDSVTWQSLTNEYWNGFTVGVQGTAAEVFNGNSVPEPSSLVLLGLGLFGLAASRKRS